MSASIRTSTFESANAIEVAAMLGDSVIGVKHCIDPAGGRITRATWALVAATTACLLAAVAALALSVHHAADTVAERQAWTAAHHPAWAFRPRPLPSGLGWLTVGGLALGGAGAVLAMLRVRRERISPYYRIGTAPGVELATEHAPSPAFPLVAPSGDRFVLHYVDGINGELISGGSHVALSALAAGAPPSRVTAGAVELAIPRDARIRAQIGQATVMISAVERPRRYSAGVLAFDRRVAAYVVGSLGLHLALWAVIRAVPPDEQQLSVQVDSAEALSLRAAGIARTESPPPEQTRAPDGGAASGEPEAAPKMALPSGETGDPRVTSEARLQLARTTEQPEPQLSREQARNEAIKLAREAGIFGSELVSSAASLATRIDFANGFDDRDVNGAIYGPDGDAGRGMFGGGVTGRDIGGGCTLPVCGPGPGTSDRYAARYDTIRTGRRTGDQFSLRDTDGPGNARRTPVIPVTRIGKPVVSGGYDRTIIRRYIRRSISEITYCYEKQLLARPALAGEVLVSFLIGGTGLVQSATGSGVDPEVADCVAGAIRRIEFPAPADGAGVQVNYPFHFVAAGR